MKIIFFDVDGVLIDGWHANSALRKPWDATLEADLGINREAFQKLFFGTPGSQSASPMFECLTGRRDLGDALDDILPKVGYQGNTDDFMRYWFKKDSNVNADVFRACGEHQEGRPSKNVSCNRARASPRTLTLERTGFLKAL
jgi:putative hydrolase of the HAD superfamily